MLLTFPLVVGWNARLLARLVCKFAGREPARASFFVHTERGSAGVGYYFCFLASPKQTVQIYGERI